MIRLRRIISGDIFFDDVVESKLQPGMFAVIPERRGFRGAGIEYREDVSHMRGGMIDQFVDSADGDLERAGARIFTHIEPHLRDSR